MVAFILSAYFSFNAFVRSGVTPVPDLQGFAPAQAEASVRDLGLEVEWSLEAQHHDSIPAGHVMRQRPRASSLVKRGTVVRVVPSLGQQVITVPDVSERALQAAQVTLAAAGLTVGSVSNVYSESGPPGTVVAQDPPPGATASMGRKVDLYMSLEQRSAVFVMPDLVYRDYEEVKRYFERKEVRMGSIKFEKYEGIARGVILRQFPQPGHVLRKTDVVSLVVTSSERDS